MCEEFNNGKCVNCGRSVLDDTIEKIKNNKAKLFIEETLKHQKDWMLNYLNNGKIPKSSYSFEYVDTPEKDEPIDPDNNSKIVVGIDVGIDKTVLTVGKINDDGTLEIHVDDTLEDYD